MIEFVTLFLGLIGGPQTIVLQADPKVSAVELRLDGSTVAALSVPPWQGEVDLGTELLPHRLVAVAFDAAGAEVARATQWLNVPRAAAEATLVLERDAAGQPVAANIAWETTLAPTPVAIRAELDGRELTVDDPRRVALGRVDASRFHFLEVSLEFDGGVTARAQLAFGGDYADTTDAALTAFPVAAHWRGDPDPGSMDGWFVGDDGPARVVAVEKGLADVVILRGPGVLEAMYRLEGLPDRSLSPGSGNSSLAPLNMTARASQDTVREQALRFDRSVRPRLLIPRARAAAGEHLQMEQFPLSPELPPGALGMVGLLSKDVIFPGLSTHTRLWDAAAVAVLQAAGSNRRRGVLVVLAGAWDDESRYDAASIRGFAEGLHVPLFFWCLDGGSRAAPVCSGVPVMGTFRELRKAMARLTGALEGQRIVWLEGRHSPAAIRLTDAARAVSVSDG